MRIAKKSLGQNFLIDKNIIKKIVNLTQIKNRNIIEIGSGTGALTEEILRRKPKSLTIIEKDRNLLNDLLIKFSENGILKSKNTDILKLNIENLVQRNSIIFGNLPYNISSQILVKLVKFEKWPPNYSDLILMFQKELAEKILGKYKTRSYSRLSILTNLRLKIIKRFNVSANCFKPRPKVVSTLLHFRPIRRKQVNFKDISNLEKITNILFSNKRKMINKNIKKVLNSKQINKIVGLNLSARPSDLSPEIYYKITEHYEKKN